MTASSSVNVMNQPISTSLTSSDILTKLPENQKEKAYEIANSIDLAQSDSIMNFGVAVQSKLDETANIMLASSTGNKDTQINELLTNMMSKINEVMPEDVAKAKKRGIFPWLKKQVEQKALEIKIKTQSISATVDGFKGQLKTHKDGLIENNKRLDSMFEQTKDYFQELNTVIAGGQIKLNELDNEIIPAKQAEYEQTQNPQLGQELMRLNQIRTDLAIRIDDLMRAQDLSLTQSYQMLMLKAGNNVLAKKLDNSVRLVLPLWKSQIAMSLILLDTHSAVEAQDVVYEMTNKLTKGVSEQVKDTSVAIANANNKSIISMETLKQTHQDLIDTVKEVQAINVEAELKRRENQKEIELEQARLIEAMGAINKPQLTNEYGNGIDY